MRIRDGAAADSTREFRKRGGVDARQLAREMNMAQILESVEQIVLIDASKRHRKQQLIADALGMSQPTVARKLRKYGIIS